MYKNKICKDVFKICNNKNAIAMEETLKDISTY